MMQMIETQQNIHYNTKITKDFTSKNLKKVKYS